MRVKVYYGKEIHIIDVDNIQTVSDFKDIVRSSFMVRLPDEIIFMTGHGDILDTNILKEINTNEQAAVKLFIVNHQDSILKSVKSEQSFQCLSNEHTEVQQPPLLEMKKSETNMDKYDNKNATDDEQLEMLLEKEKQYQSYQDDSRIKNKQVLNEDIQCDGCFAFPIKGPIFKCLACPNFDLCASCQQTKHHYHPFLKITRENQYPIHTKVSFSKESKREMIGLRLQEESLINQRKEKDKKAKEMIRNYQVVPLSKLKVTQVCAKNFLSEILGPSF